MEQYRLMLNCARFFAAAAFILFFSTSCTNYWLHAITCPMENKTQMEETDTVPESSQPLTESIGNATELTSSADLPSSSEILNGSTKSSGMNPSMLRNDGTFQYWKQKKLNKFSKYTLLLRNIRVTYHHEGFFWRCSFTDKREKNELSKFIYIYQPPVKCCIHAFHSPFPNDEGRTTVGFQSSLSFRKSWSALMFLAVIIITIGFVCIIYKACFQKYSMYKAVGVIFLMGGVSFLVSIIMYIYWISAVSQMIAEETELCSALKDDVKYGVSYGWSFMAAPFAIFFSLIAGFLFIKVSGNAYKESGAII